MSPEKRGDRRGAATAASQHAAQAGTRQTLGPARPAPDTASHLLELAWLPPAVGARGGEHAQAHAQRNARRPNHTSPKPQVAAQPRRCRCRAVLIPLPARCPRRRPCLRVAVHDDSCQITKSGTKGSCERAILRATIAPISVKSHLSFHTEADMRLTKLLRGLDGFADDKWVRCVAWACV